MQSFGRSPDDALREQTYRELRARSVNMWGEERTAANEQTLRRTADAVARMHDLEFDITDAPGFFLREFEPEPDSPPERAE